MIKETSFETDNT